MNCKKDSVMTASGEAPLDIVENAGAELSGWLGALSESKQRKNAAKDLVKNPAEVTDKAPVNNTMVGLQHVFYREYIAPGTWLVSEQHIDDEITGKASVGCFLKALANFANEQSYGGCSRVGYGKFDLMTFMDVGNGQQVSPIINSNGKFVVNDASEYVVEAIAAWEKVASEVTGK